MTEEAAPAAATSITEKSEDVAGNSNSNSNHNNNDATISR
jgi:hypothetical protein